MRRLPRRGLALGAALAVTAGVLVFVAAVGHRPLAYVTRDPQATTLERWFLGFFSNVGSALWWGAAAMALLGGLVLLDRRAAGGRGPFLLGVAALTAMFGFDDMFGIHDVWGHAAGIPEWPFFLLYGGAAFAVLWGWRRHVARTWVGALVLAVTLYAFSTLVDWMTGHSESDLRYLGEDGVKLLGIVCWAAWVGHTTYRALQSPEPASP